MLTLTQQAYQAARAILFAQGRPLDQQRFRFYFEGGAPAAVLAELAAFQNADGGFGWALEPDMRATASSAIATAHALAILREVGAGANEAIVQRAVAYLLATYDTEQRVWPIVPPAIEEAPHAPWWNYAESPKNFGGFVVNPKVALVGYLHDYPGLTPPEFLTQATTEVLDHLDTVNELNMFDLHCYLELAETPRLPAAQQSQVRAKLRTLVPASVVTDPTQWEGYCLLPLDVITSPTSFLADVVDQTAVGANLDFWISHQLPNGAWPIPWSWSFVDAQAWAQAEQDWQGFLLVNHLRILHAFGRVEGLASDSTNAVRAA